MTEFDGRLLANGNPFLTEFDDDHRPDHKTWEHNVTAARWSPATGWTIPA